MSEKPVKRYHMTHDRDYQRILAEVSGQEFLKFAQYVRSEDYDALKAENERLTADNERLKADIEALRRDAESWRRLMSGVGSLDADMEDKT